MASKKTKVLNIPDAFQLPEKSYLTFLPRYVFVESSHVTFPSRQLKISSFKLFQFGISMKAPAADVSAQLSKMDYGIKRGHTQEVKDLSSSRIISKS